MSPASSAHCPSRLAPTQDFTARIKKYEAIYETITDRRLHYIKLIDMVTGEEGIGGGGGVRCGRLGAQVSILMDKPPGAIGATANPSSQTLDPTPVARSSAMHSGPPRSSLPQAPPQSHHAGKGYMDVNRISGYIPGKMVFFLMQVGCGHCSSGGIG